jgi:maltose-binding protein MalE
MHYVAMVLFINKTLYENAVGNPDELYAKALEGSWTMESMEQIIKGCYSDLNGDSTTDPEDQFGFATYYAASSTDAFAFATDIHLTGRDENGSPYFTMGIERQIKAAELMNRIFWNESSYIHQKDGDITGEIFKNGRTLILGNQVLGGASGLRDMEDDFGMIPFPKFDEA